MFIGIDASRATGERLTGTELYSREIIRHLVQAAPQHRFRLYTRVAATPGLFVGYASNAEVVHIQQPRLWTHVGLAREIAARPPDALLIPAHVLPLPGAWHFRTATPIKTVVTVHDVGYRYFPSAHPLKQRLYLDLSTAFSARFASQIIAVSQATQQDVMKFYHAPASKITVAHEGIVPLPETNAEDEEVTRIKFNLSTNQPYFLHIGTLQPRKNLRRLLIAFAAVRDSFQSSQSPQSSQSLISNLQSPLLVLAGGAGWGAEDLPGLARSLGVAEQVRFAGYISDVEKAALLRGAFAYVAPSLYEGFGLPVLEAQSVGTPVLCSNTSSLPEVAGDGALLFNPAHEQAIAAALQCILLDANLRTRLINKGYENVKRFSWHSCAMKILGVLEEGG